MITNPKFSIEPRRRSKVKEEKKREELKIPDNKQYSEDLRLSYPDYKSSPKEQINKAIGDNAYTPNIEEDKSESKDSKSTSEFQNIPVEKVIKIQKVVRGFLFRNKYKKELAEYMKEIEEPELVKSIFQLREERAVNIIAKTYLRMK